VLVSCRPDRLADAVKDRLEAFDTHPVHLSAADLRATAAVTSPPHPTTVRRSPHAAGRRLCACVVVDGDAPLLPQCLASLDEVADSTVVVEAEGVPDRAAVRNRALDEAQGGWVLVIEAGQTLDPASVRAVREAVAADRFVGYTARLRHQVGLDGLVSTVEERAAVLFPRHPDLRFVGWAVPQLQPRPPLHELYLAPTLVVLHQHHYDQERHDPVARARRDLGLLEQAIAAEPGEPYHRYCLGAALARLGLKEEGDAALRRSIEQAPKAPWAAPALLARARIAAADGRPGRAAKLARAAAERAPDWAVAWCVLGAARADAGRHDDALAAYERALDCTTMAWPGDADQPGEAAWLARAGIGRIHLARGEHGAAAQCLEAAVASNPASPELRLFLARAYEAVGRASDGRRHLERAAAAPRTGPDAFTGMADFFLGKAESALLRGLADNPESRVLLDRIERLRAAQAMRSG
jgi:Flp pilus assembly protein TadD